MAWHVAAERILLHEGRGWPVRVAGRNVALFAVGAEIFAVDNHCLHAGSPLDDGALSDGCLTCPWHGWRYDLASGKLLGADGGSGLRTYATKVIGDDVLVELVED